MLRIGLIGVGRHGERYARHLVRDALGAELVGLARRNSELAKRQAQEFGCRAYSDFRELIAAPEVEAVVVVVPPTLHLEIVEAAATAGKPTLVEKPAAPNLDVGARLRAIVKRTGLFLMVAQTLRFNGVVRTLRAAIPEIGPIHSLRVGQRFEPSRPGWIDEPQVAGGGMILHTGVHCFDLVRYLTGQEVRSVTCMHSQVRSHRTEDNFACTLRLEDGRCLASVAGSRATASRSGGVEIAGAEGQLVGDHVSNRVLLIRGMTETALPVPEPVPTVRETLCSFVAAVRDRVPPPISLEEGLRAVAIADACYRAARSGKEEPVSWIVD